MTELVERLRAEHARNGGQGAYAWQSRELCGKAADEIERLEAEKAQIVEQIVAWMREEGASYQSPIPREIIARVANALERGDHLKTDQG